MTQNSPSRHLDKFVLRMPEGMRDQISENAIKHSRSMNSEIINALENYLGHEEWIHIKEKPTKDDITMLTQYCLSMKGVEYLGYLKIKKDHVMCFLISYGFHDEVLYSVLGYLLGLDPIGSYNIDNDSDDSEPILGQFDNFISGQIETINIHPSFVPNTGIKKQPPKTPQS